MTRNQVLKELRRLVREALIEDGGTGGRQHCQYCLRESYQGQPQHYRVDVKSDSPGCDVEADEPCAVDIMRAAIKELTK